MNFLFLTQYFPPEIGAPQTRLIAMSRELVSRGHSVEIVTALPNYPQGRIFKDYKGSFYRVDRNEMIVHRVWLYACVGRGFKRILNYVSFSLTCMIGLIRSQKPDFVFIESPPLFLTVPGILFARVVGARPIFNVADLWPDSVVDMELMRKGLLIRLATKLESWAYRRSVFVIAMTEGIRDSLRYEKGVPEAKLMFLPNGVDLELYHPRQPDLQLKQRLGLEDKKLILYQGTQGYAHGLEAVMHAAALLRDDTSIHFLFVGNGSERRELEAVKARLHLANVTFVDFVPLSELPRFFSIAECGLVSLRRNRSFKGARPAKCNPIFASAKPVLFFGEGEGAELVKQAKAGIVVPYGDLQGLADAARYLVHNSSIAAQLGINGRRYAEQHLGWPAVISSWLTELLRRSTSRTETPGLARVH
ncbi:MAG: glycosyltransferase family 4 protein [Acidobacteriaceae bacterium]|nr:glycosyltransferase family 4 protein [Acidobacteriaceae bacterium]